MIRDLIFQDHDPYANAKVFLESDLQGWNSEHSIFESLIEEKKPKTICEVGTWKGASAIHMARFVDPSCEIVCVDTWLGSIEMFRDSNKRKLMALSCGRSTVYETFLSNVIRSQNEHIITPFPATSVMAARFFRQHEVKFDLIYIDASHEYNDVLHDINIWAARGHFVFGDDYDWPSVQQALDKYLSYTPNRNLQVFEEKWVLC